MSVAASGRVIPPPPETSDSRTFRRAFADLVDGLYNSELWLHLGWTDIKQRYRRSVLGPLWITVATGVTAVAMGILYGTLFGFDIKDFLPYVILGLIFWNFIQNSILDGAVVFSTNEGLIKQLPAPISVHVYRVVWRQLIIFAHNVVIFLVVVAVFRPPITWSALLFFPAMALFVLNAIWVTIVFGILSTRFRDISQLTTTIVQLAFFMTPIIWKLGPAMGNKVGSRARLVELNPLFHYIEITRGPLLGEHVQFYHWAVVLGCTAVGCAAALVVMRNYRARVAYWV
ncbi:MAG TPA: ABC transporter permease [Gordonia sp. (in: high G+C Gram-positive bacteria)]|uniref:galactan export ABC transporter permease subunit Wzm/RfbD n=1 Tax=unclassified Gordonia (in: high G+C Gram-positive bacteria) TaxID=2657482 RepID=UPI000FBA366F|nr:MULTISPECIES: ABC transporter permease [unclassified Gordonia (in: high G+C Gram-positive bacteria)]RUP38703.1 MAG: ABC transporter permease [Gordonia sp. (in: high G+C Gram-positive bacteria)]HNP58528.1 ABC transporter permease [Gordonia sp. (in: high G+C Gram-positive bacteria)]HRC50275.1 ABC transporter permease [Gordonia sp. (in: high G+C Gram-positive bacteria)]